MQTVTVVCQGCGREFTYETMFIATVGVAVCPHCGVRDGQRRRAANPRLLSMWRRATIAS